MTFAAPQIRKLKSKLKPAHVKTREADGISLSYLEGWHVVAEANRIFGFDGWDRETVANSCVWTKQTGSRYCAAYVARVAPTAMIFVPCRGGISHNEAEFTSKDQCAAGAQVLLQAVLDYDRWLADQYATKGGATP